MSIGKILLGLLLNFVGLLLVFVFLFVPPPTLNVDLATRAHIILFGGIVFVAGLFFDLLGRLQNRP